MIIMFCVVSFVWLVCDKFCIVCLLLIVVGRLHRHVAHERHADRDREDHGARAPVESCVCVA